MASPLGPMDMVQHVALEIFNWMRSVKLGIAAILFTVILGLLVMRHSVQYGEQDLDGHTDVFEVSAVLGHGTTSADDRTCDSGDGDRVAPLHHEFQSLKYEVWLLWMSVGILFVFYIGSSLVMFWFWKHFTREVDGMSDHWTHGDIQFENLRQETRRVASETVSLLNDHIGRHEREIEVLEDYIEGVRYGLVENGGFMRHNALTMSLRGNMFSWERSNIVLHNMRMRSTEDTDMQAGDEMREPEGGDGYGQMPHSDMEEGWEGSVTIPRMINDLRRAQNEALSRGDGNEGGETQRLLVALLQRHNGLLDPMLADDLFNFYRRAYRRSQNAGYHEFAALYDSWAMEIRDLVDWGDQ